MNAQELFIITFRVWFALLLITNLIGLIFLKSVDDQVLSHYTYNSGLAAIVTNFILGYLILLYNHYVINKVDPFYDDTKSFYKWTVHVFMAGDDQCIMAIIWIIFAMWAVPNLVMLASCLQGILWIPGIHFIMSLFYWTVFVIISVWSNSNPTLV